MSRSVPTLLVLLLLASASLACSGSAASSSGSADPAPADAPRVRVIRLTRAPLARSVTVTGTLAAEEQVMLSLEVTGRLQTLDVDLGSRVRRGQVIGRLSPTDFELRLQQAEAALQQARARLGLPPQGDDDAVDPEQTGVVRQAVAARDDAQLKRDRIAAFVTRGISPKADLDSAEATLEIARGRVQDALEEVRNRQGVLAQRRSEVALARQMIEDSVLRSPIDGVVRERHAFAGEYRAAGSPIVTVVRQDPLRLQLAVPERAATDVRVGQPVRVSIEGDPRTYEGRVARLSPAIAEGNRTLPVEAEVPNPDGALRPGAFATAEIVTSRDDALTLPQSAVVTFAGVEKVMTVADGRTKEQQVRTGRRLNGVVEILEGLEVGQLVLAEPGSIADGTAVRAEEEE
jgi:RND family efflux transporter MFP subunit